MWQTVRLNVEDDTHAAVPQAEVGVVCTHFTLSMKEKVADFGGHRVVTFSAVLVCRWVASLAHRQVLKQGCGLKFI